MPRKSSFGEMSKNAMIGIGVGVAVVVIIIIVVMMSKTNASASGSVSAPVSSSGVSQPLHVSVSAPTPGPSSSPSPISYSAPAPASYSAPAPAPSPIAALLEAVTSAVMPISSYLYGKEGTNMLLYTSPNPTGPWTSPFTTPGWVVRVSRTPTGIMGTGGDGNIYVSPVIAQSGPWTMHPTLPATKNYFQVLSLIDGNIAGLNTTRGPNGGYNMTLNGSVIEGNKNSFSNQVFQLSDGTVGRLDAGNGAHINVGHTSFNDSLATGIYPSKDTYKWILPMQDGSVYSIGSDNNLYYSKTGFSPPSGGAIGSGAPVWVNVSSTKDYAAIF